ncbi:MAG: threonine synthase [Gammaproteobacteria bacterium]|jgi:threonine synthase
MPHYIDPRSNRTFALDTPIWRSPSGHPLLLTRLGAIQPEAIDHATRSLWRYRKSFPIDVQSPISMGEGCTPLVASTFADARCLFKLEWFSPTGSFKDRGTSVMLSMLRQQGVASVLEDSSGNGGSSVAAYGAAGGMRVKVLVPASTSAAKIVQIRAYGAQVELIPGPREATEAAAIAQSSQTFYASHNWHPFFLQGTKTLGYELWEDLDFTAPDNIIIPVGAGSNLLGCHMAFEELKSSAQIKRMPRLFASQPANCAPLHASFQAASNDYVDCEFHPTIAEGTAIKRPIRLPEMLKAIRETNGGTVAVSEAAIVDASLALARQGLYVEPTCAHAAAAFSTLLKNGTINEADKTVVVLTGTGLKTTAFYDDLLTGKRDESVDAS